MKKQRVSLNLSDIDVHFINGEYYVKVHDLFNPEILHVPKRVVTKEDNLVSLRQIRSEYTLNPDNPYLKYFKKHSDSFYNFVAGRLALKNSDAECTKSAFGLMAEAAPFSIMDFLSCMPTSTHEKLIDFTYIVNNGVVSAASREGKAAVQLAEFVDKGRTSLREIEDCFYWMLETRKWLTSSLSGVLSILSTYQNQRSDAASDETTSTLAMAKELMRKQHAA